MDVIVRDRNGNVVKGLTEKDFVVTEDGRAQEVRTFTFAEIKEGPATAASMELLAGVEEKVLSNTSPSTARPSAAVEAASPAPIS